MARLDHYTIDKLGLDGKILMSNAAREILRVIRERYPRCRHPVIYAGTGNNGGDGVALAYYAQQHGLTPHLVICHPEVTSPPKLSEDSDYFFNIAERAYVPYKLLDNPVQALEPVMSSQGDLLVDALFGTGLDRPLSEFHCALVDRINNAGLPVVAVDAPSGLNCTTGQVMGTVVRAELTVTMGYPKCGFYHPAAGQAVGELEVVELGFAPPSEAAVAADCHDWSDALWEPLRRPRMTDTHKGDYGKLLIVAGHQRYPGAPRLAAEAAVRLGAGLTRLVVPAPIYTTASDNPAVMTDSHPADADGGFAAEPSAALKEYLDWADALVIGPGLGDGDSGIELTRQLLADCDIPAVVDADALRVLPIETSGRDWPLVLTPHVGELARLAELGVEQTLADWFAICRSIASRDGVFLLAKSNQCLLATPEDSIIFPHRGDPALATGGTGDVLSGMIGALLARCHALSRSRGAAAEPGASARQLMMVEAVVSAVNLHAAAARAGAAEWGAESLSPADLPGLLPDALRMLAAARQDGQL